MDSTQKSFPSRFFGHLHTINAHKVKVTGLCFRVGLVKQGLLHDLSKYSWVEFSSGVRYFQGDHSPIEEEKRHLGYSLGWLHHKGRNKHHYEYWTDKNWDGFRVLRMPYNYLVESFCDRIGACMVYQKEHFTNRSPYEYFITGTDRLYMHPDNVEELLDLLLYLHDHTLDEGLVYAKEHLKAWKAQNKTA